MLALSKSLNTKQENIAQKAAFSVQEVSELTSLSVPFIRKEIYAKKLKAKKFGTRTLILQADLQNYLESSNETE